MTLSAPDVYFKKVVRLHLPGISCEFRVSQALFSSHEVDEGTRLLLGSMRSIALPRGAAVLDLGCGYGPVGIALAKEDPGRQVRMVDRDALAISYARQNATLNGVEAEVSGSLGYDDVGDARFDLIALNVPAKAGERVIAHLLLGAAAHLRPGGTVATVAVAPLASLVGNTLRSELSVRITHESHGRGYAVVHYTFDGPPRAPVPFNAFQAGIYDRDQVRLDAVDGVMVRTAYGLPEFDTPSFATQLLLHELSAAVGSPQHLAVFNPGQGYGAAFAARLTMPERISLIDRDLLALRCTRANVIAGGTPVERIASVHDVGLRLPPSSADLIVATLREDEGTAAAMQVVDDGLAALTPDGRMLLAATSTMGTRLVKHASRARDRRLVELRRRKGNVVLEITRRG